MSAPRAWRGRVFVGMSLDGYLARPDSDLDWLTNPPAGIPHEQVSSSDEALEWESFFPGIDHLVMGRGTYEKVLTFGDWPYEGKRVLVLSSTLRTDDPRITQVHSLHELVDLLEGGEAREVYLDGGRLIQSCLAADLVDEITVAIAPVIIGAGIPLFGLTPRDVRLRLRGTHAAAGGMVHITYDVLR